MFGRVLGIGLIAALCLCAAGCGADVSHHHDKQQMDVHVHHDPQKIDITIHRGPREKRRIQQHKCPCGADCRCVECDCPVGR